MILLVVRYRDDSERKRVEYLVEKYSGRLSFRRPGGAVFFVDDGMEDIEGFLEELFSRLGPDVVEVYDVSRSENVPSPRVARLMVSSGMDCEEAFGALAFIMARLRGSLYFDLGSVRQYIVRTRRGWGRVRAEARESKGGGCVLIVEVEAYEPAFSYLLDGLRRELMVIGEVNVE